VRQPRPPDRRLHLMHLVYNLGTGGMENTLIQVCNRLPTDEFRPTICVLEAGGGMEGRVDTERVELIHVPRRFGNDPTVPFRVARQLRRRRIDILQTNQWATLIEGIVAAKIARVPILVHGEHGKIRGRRRQIVAQRWVWSRVNQVYAVSAALADRAARVVGFPRDRIGVINNSVDTEHFRPAVTPKGELRKRFGLPTSGLLVGMVARFVPFKDHAGVIKALARLRQADLDVRLAFVGNGPLRDELAQLAKDLRLADRVHFLGEMEQVRPLLQALDVFVSNSSHNEGLSLSVLEAMACGVAVVSTRVAASPEVLAGGVAGVLIPPRDTDALVNALRELTENPQRRISLALAGCKRAEEHYSVVTMVEGYRDMYARLFAPCRKNASNTTRAMSHGTT